MLKDNKDRIVFTSRGEVHYHKYKDPNSLTLGQFLWVVAIALGLIAGLVKFFGFAGIMLW